MYTAINTHVAIEASSFVRFRRILCVAYRLCVELLQVNLGQKLV